MRTMLKKVTVQLRYLSVRFFFKNRQYWKKRDKASVKGYWDYRNHPSNDFLRQLIESINFKSVLEIGSNCGNRLWNLGIDHPNAHFIGIDLNQDAIEFGRERLQSANIKNIELHCLDATNLKAVPKQPFDIVFSWATLMYIEPEEIEHVMREIYCMANKAIVIIEMHDSSLVAPQKVRGVFKSPRNWKRNYEKILESLGVHESQIEIHNVPEDIWNPGGGHAKAIIVKL